MNKRFRDLLLYLEGISDAHLFLIIVAHRIIFLLYMICSCKVYPLLFSKWLKKRGLYPSLEGDSSGVLFNETRLTMLHNWDGMHMYHIAFTGYTMDKNYAFFPLFPHLIRIVHWFITGPFPFLHRLAPVSLYISLINIMACAFAGVILRRLTVLTMLGVEAEESIPFWPVDPRGKDRAMKQDPSRASCQEVHAVCDDYPRKSIETLSFSILSASNASAACHSTSFKQIYKVNQSEVSFPPGTDDRRDGEIADTMVCLPNAFTATAFRIMQGWHGTILDKMPPVLLASLPLDAKSVLKVEKVNSAGNVFAMQKTGPLSTNSWGDCLVFNTVNEVMLRRRTVGGGVLFWIFTPAMVFTVANYTESIFSLLMIFGTYMLACYEPLPKASPSYSKARDKRIGFVVSRCPFPSENAPGDVNSLKMHTYPSGPSIQWKAAFFSWYEMAALTCFFLASCMRSNGFISFGFLLYPTVLQIFFPALYRERWEVLHGPCWARCVRSMSQEKSLNLQSDLNRHARALTKGGGNTGLRGKNYLVHTLYTPTRWPHPLRLIVILFEAMLIFVPYFTMGYLGWKQNVRFWDELDRRMIGNRFWMFYNIIQKKYWDVGFMRPYQIRKLGWLALGWPIGIYLAYTLYRYAFRPALRSFNLSSAPRLSKLNVNTERPTFKRVEHIWSVLQRLVFSCNVVYICILFWIAYTIMHTQVSTRFLMPTPALYWAVGSQFATEVNSRKTFLIMLHALLWGHIGGFLFSNFLNWT